MALLDDTTKGMSDVSNLPTRLAQLKPALVAEVRSWDVLMSLAAQQSVHSDIRAAIEEALAEGDAVPSEQAVKRSVEVVAFLAKISAENSIGGPMATISATVDYHGRIEIVTRWPLSPGRLSAFISQDGSHLKVIGVDGRGGAEEEHFLLQ